MTAQIRKSLFGRRSPFGILKFRLLAFLAVLGPGFITANVDNDPGSSWA